ncbi:MAG: NAD(P)-dependent alcohol dehydrogenase [Alphaproteobacteria bacterium]|nr:NAD(P)-dependent alcohol dehydrogenase [Alphaproteobacteria bacterium]MCB9791088.1 NAD(P)-dependent alcohol dehydrogenase [Alphaproteobacteria bacterium]
MRAAIVNQYGTPDTIELAERPAPTPGPTELLVRVHASPVTQGDRRVRAGDFPGFMATVGRLLMGWSGPRAAVPGSMFSGVVEAVGAQVTRFQPGDRVFGASMDSAHAELLVIDHAKAVAHMPEGVSFTDAAAVPFGAGTALPYLRELGEVKPGQRVLIVGAAGGVGRYAVQVARHLGARVTAVCRRDQEELVRALGAHAVILRESTDWREADETWDVIFDTSDVFTFEDARPRLAPEGRFLTLGLSTWSGVWDLLRSSRSSGQRARWTVVMNSQADMEEVAGLLASGAVRPVLGPSFPLAHLADAHRSLESRAVEGDVMIDVIAA